MWPDAEVVPVIHAPVEAERLDGAQDNAAGLAAVERAAREVDREVRVAEVLWLSSAPPSRTKENKARTWYTVPPPLRRRMKGTPAARSAGKFTSFHGFWFRPMTTHGASR